MSRHKSMINQPAGRRLSHNWTLEAMKFADLNVKLRVSLVYILELFLEN
jgi:hypothetical protein